MSVDLAGASAEGQDQLQRSTPAVLAFDLGRSVRVGCQRVRLPLARLQFRHLVSAEDVCAAQRPCVEIVGLLDLGDEGYVPQYLGRAPPSLAQGSRQWLERIRLRFSAVMLDATPSHTKLDRQFLSEVPTG